MSYVQPKINVCVATYKRPKLLENLLQSLRAQETRGEFSFSIIVVDNDSDRSAEAVVRDFNETAATGAKIIYAVEPEPNISLARNRSLSLATGDHIATIDDDEYADAQWLLNLYLAINSYNADVVHGPVIAEFPLRTPDYIRECFIRPNPVTGSTDNYVLNTGNSLFRRKLVKNLEMPFDPRFGRTGGGDSAFFHRLKKNGCRMIWCREARVFEPVPSERTNLSWILKRKFRIGNVIPLIRDNPASPRAAKIRLSCRQVVKLSSLFFLFMICSIFHPKHRDTGVKHLLGIACQLGILAHYAKFHYKEYNMP